MAAQKGITGPRFPYPAFKQPLAKFSPGKWQANGREAVFQEIFLIFPSGTSSRQMAGKWRANENLAKPTHYPQYGMYFMYRRPAAGSWGLIKCLATASLMTRETIPADVSGNPRRSRKVALDIWACWTWHRQAWR